MIPKISLDNRFDDSNKENRQTLTNNIIINNGNGLKSPEKEKEVEVKYIHQPSEVNGTIFIPPPNNLYDIPSVEVQGSELDNILKENKHLRSELYANQIIFEMIKTNPIYINKLILVDDEKLIKLIKIFTDAEEVTLDFNEDISSCCGFNNSDYRYVNTIYVKKDGKISNFKYSYPEVIKRINELGINLKVVF